MKALVKALVKACHLGNRASSTWIISRLHTQATLEGPSYLTAMTVCRLNTKYNSGDHRVVLLLELFSIAAMVSAQLAARIGARIK